MLATTRGTLLRGTRLDELGDEIDDNEGEIGHIEHVPTTYTPWVETRRNLFRAPYATTTAAPWASGAGSEHSVSTDFPGRATAMRSTRTGVTASRALELYLGSATPDAGLPLSMYCLARSSRPLWYNVFCRTQAGVSAGQQSLGMLNVTPEPQVVILSGLSSGSNGSSAGINIIAPADPAGLGDWLEIADVSIEQAATIESFLAGDTYDPPQELRRSAWIGTPPSSAYSVLESRAVDVPAHDVWVIDKPSAVVAGADDFPLSLIERETREQDPATNTWRTVRYFAARVPHTIPVQYGDRIRDRRDGKVYAVDSIKSAPRSLAGRSSTTLKLRRA